MVDPIVTLTAAKLLELAFTKLVESGAGEAGKKFTEVALKQMDDLRQAIVNRLQGRSEKVNEALAKLEQGDRSGLETVAKNLDVVMDESPEFAQQLQTIGQELHQVLVQMEDGAAKNVQQIFGGQGLQVNEKQDQPIIQIQGNPTLHIGKPPNG